MLGLTLPTDPKWINIAEKNINEILTDHAKKRYSNGGGRKDQYVKYLYQFFPKGYSCSDRLVYKLLYVALIDARSCKIFRLLSE
jgi:tRNA-(ms[2]io[6]A)-hydroxylase